MSAMTHSDERNSSSQASSQGCLSQPQMSQNSQGVYCTPEYQEGDFCTPDEQVQGLNWSQGSQVRHRSFLTRPQAKAGYFQSGVF